MSLRNKALSSLLAVQVLVLVAAQALPEGSGQDTETVMILPGFDKAKVTTLTINGAKKPGMTEESEVTVLKRTGDDWSLASGGDYPAKTGEVNQALALLGRLKSRTKVLDQATYHDKLEVSEARYQRKIEVDLGGQKQVFFLGSSPTFKTAHVRRAGEAQVYQVSDLTAYDLDSRATKWVERSYLDIPEVELWAVTVENRNGRLQLERSPDTQQWLVAGITGVPKESEVKKLIGKARKINLEAPVGKKVETLHGFDDPTAKVILFHGAPGSDGAPPAQTTQTSLMIGSKIDGKDRYFAKLSSSPHVVEVAGWGIQPLGEAKLADFAPEPPKPTVQ